MDQESLINYVSNIDIDRYYIKGGYGRFLKEHPNIIEYVYKYTNSIDYHDINKGIFQKLLFIKKYKCISLKPIIFDRQLKDFKESNINAAKKYWSEFNLRTEEYYSKDYTVEFLKNNYQKYIGKSGNRKLIRDNIKLYDSLYYHTQNLDSLNKNKNKFTMRMFILKDNIEIFCEKHQIYKTWRFINNDLDIYCKKCTHKNYPSIDYFKYKYKSNWSVEYAKYKEKHAKRKLHSREWFIKKYGEETGIEKYEIYVEKLIKQIAKLKGNRYSKISQDLFWKIHKKLKDTSNIYFFEKNQEFVLRIPPEYNYDKTVMILDFKKDNKIIEYNGKYWHNEEDDDIRKKILNDMGYDVLYVYSDDYNRNNKNKKIIEDCVKFLTC
jgi:hypothetical protein